MKTLLLLLLTALMPSCAATVSMLPESASEVDFDGEEGKTGWAEYQNSETFHGYNIDQVYEAAKVGLGESGFALRVADKSKGVVIGEHGMTMHDWNVIAGVYFRQEGDATKVKVIVEGSKDLNLFTFRDNTSGGWTGEILGNLRRYLNSTYQSILKVDKDDLKQKLNN